MGMEESDLDVQLDDELSARIQTGPTEQDEAIAGAVAGLAGNGLLTWASVNQAGNKVRGSGVWFTFKSTSGSGIGKYGVVLFPPATAINATYVASLGSAEENTNAIEGTIKTYPFPGSPGLVLVVTRDLKGVLTDSPFHIMIAFP